MILAYGDCISRDFWRKMSNYRLNVFARWRLVLLVFLWSCLITYYWHFFKYIWQKNTYILKSPTRCGARKWYQLYIVVNIFFWFLWIIFQEVFLIVWSPLKVFVWSYHLMFMLSMKSLHWFFLRWTWNR